MVAQTLVCGGLFLLALLFTCPPAHAQTKPLYLDPSAPLDRRVDDLISRMTLEEKVAQLMNDAPPIDRLDVPAYNWWNECLHGVARAGRATVFPETIGLAATWDTALLGRVSAAISDEARAKYHEFVRRGKRNIYQGLTFWTPNINLFRDPRWGRGMETYGEDPYLTGRMAVTFIHGLQGDDPKYLKTVATAKHYAVHSGPESERHTFDAVPDERDLVESYLPHFEAAVKEGGAFSVMCAYNSVDGKPACANSRLLADTLRKQWGFEGYVVSDCGAITDIYKGHHFVSTVEEASAKAVLAGTDLDCGTEYAALVPAVHSGLIAESEIDRSVKRLFVARFKLGMFDPPQMVPYAKIPYSVNDSPEHRQLALEAARKSIVLLKNDNHTLPLSHDLKTIAVIGPNADDPDVLVGNYNGEPSAPVTPLAGIRHKLAGHARVLYARGGDLAANLPAFETIPSSALLSSETAGAPHGLRGEYFATANFDGKLHRPRELTYPGSGRMVGQPAPDAKPLFTRVDPEVNFMWWDGSPRQDLNDDDFGVRWTGFLRVPASGKYQIGATGLNAYEVYVDGKPVAETNDIHERSYHYATLDLEAGKSYAIRLDYHEFAGDACIRLVWAHPSGPADVAAALEAARQADTVVLVTGLSPRLEGEEMSVPVAGFKGGDRVDLGIPREQQELMEKIVALGKPVVLVLLNGSALAVNWARDHVPAIVEAWYPGEAGGDALADVLFGDYNPAGRLPVTFYKSADQLPPFTDYDMAGRTYRYFSGEPLYPFGYGLSYTTFSYRNLIVPKTVATRDPVKVSVEVSNTGKLPGEEVVELYLKSDAGGAPLRSLEGFQRVALAPGQNRVVEFTITPRQFALAGADGRLVIQPGTFEVAVGGKQPGFAGAADAATTGVVSSGLTLQGAARRVE
jgi:beta-glucosidase